jgi:hypothetical protein
MGIIDLDAHLIAKGRQIGKMSQVPVENVLDGSGGQQELLLEPNSFSDLVVVVRIENIGEERIFGGLIEKAGIEPLQGEITGRFLRGPNPQCANIEVLALRDGADLFIV